MTAVTLCWRQQPPDMDIPARASSPLGYACLIADDVSCAYMCLQAAAPFA